MNITAACIAQHAQCELINYFSFQKTWPAKLTFSHFCIDIIYGTVGYICYREKEPCVNKIKWDRVGWR
jgi:hypothetical protein